MSGEQHPAHTGQPIRTVPFVEAPCACVKHHYPVVLVCQRHHPFMQSEQVRLFGAVVDKRTVALCGSSHDSCHLLMDAIAAGRDPYALTHNRYLLRAARVGCERLAEAEHDVATLGREAARARWRHAATEAAW